MQFYFLRQFGLNDFLYGKLQNLPSLLSPLRHCVYFRLANDTFNQRKRYI